MTLTILASVSLLALVSTARPLRDDEARQFNLSANKSPEVQSAAHAVLTAHAGKNSIASHGNGIYGAVPVSVHVASEGAQQAFLALAAADGGAVHALVPLAHGSTSAVAQELIDILSRLDAEGRVPVSDEALDIPANTVDAPADSEPATPETKPTATPASAWKAARASPDVHALVLTASCIGALLVVLCIGAALYAVQLVRGRVLASKNAWDILPRLERRGGYESQGGPKLGKAGVRDAVEVVVEGMTEKNLRETGAERLPALGIMLWGDDDTLVMEKLDEKACGFSGEGEDDMEIFLDAHSNAGSTYATPRLDSTILPSEDTPYATPDPPLLALPPSPAVAARNLEMREAVPQVLALAVPRPLPSGPDRARVAEGRERARAFAAMPELDAALAMQLRPGLGLGADAAWLVRFVMAFFGWFGVLVSSGTV